MLQAPDFDASLEFYTEALGFKTKYPVIDAQTGRWVEIETPGVTIGLHEVMDKGTITPLPENAPRLGFNVDDLDAAKQELESRNVKFAPQGFETPAIRFAFFSDPAGNPCYLAQLIKN